MQPKKIVFWDWNGTLLDDVEFTRGCLNWLLEQHGYPQRYDLAAYREVFGFPIEAYYQRAGFDFSRHPYPVLARRFMGFTITLAWTAVPPLHRQRIRCRPWRSRGGARWCCPHPARIT